jgi:type VI secretion system secreted protein Hcp
MFHRGGFRASRCSVSCLAAILVAAFAPTARGAFDAFLDIQGIPGESANDKHKNQIEIRSFSTAVTQNASPAAGGGGKAAGKAELGDFTVVKHYDAASPQLFLYACNGKHIPKVTLDVCRATTDKESYLKYTLEDVIVVSVRTGGSPQSDESTPTEEVVFRYAKIGVEYTPQTAKGGKGSSVKTGWDVTKNAAASASPEPSAKPDATAAAPAAPAEAAAAPAPDAQAAASASAPAPASPAVRARVRRTPADTFERAQPKQP